MGCVKREQRQRSETQCVCEARAETKCVGGHGLARGEKLPVFTRPFGYSNYQGLVIGILMASTLPKIAAITTDMLSPWSCERNT